MAKRKRMGNALLVVTAGATAISVAGCPFTTGNLVAPATVQLCLEVTPDEAVSTVGSWGDVEGDGCTAVYASSDIVVTTVAEGYETHNETLSITEDSTLTIELTPSSDTDEAEDTEAGG